MRLIGYVRVSRVAGRGGESFISPTDQRERIEKHASAQGHTVVAWQEDLDQPGSRAARPGFQAALRAVETGEADGIICAKLDRFSRSIRDALDAMARVEAAGGQFIAVADSFDTSTPTGRMTLNVLLSFAQFELDRIRESWAASGTRAAQRGVHVCRTPPVGYLRGNDGRLEIDPIAAPVVRDVFRQRATGASWIDLCRLLDERLSRENGKRWVRSTVSTLIACRTYLGEARGGGIVNNDAHPPLITRGEFEAAQVAGGDGRRDRGSDGGALLAGILRCGCCGHKLTRMGDGERGYTNYRCRKLHTDGVCDAPAKISLRRADAYVEQEFLAQLEREPLAASGKAADGSLEQAVVALEAAERELSEYVATTAVSIIGRDVFTAGLTARQQTVEDARRRLGEAHAGSPLDGFRDLARLWPSLDVRERRHLLGSVLDHVVVGPARGSGQGTPVAERLQLVWR